MASQPPKVLETSTPQPTNDTNGIRELESECLKKDMERIELSNTMLKNENEKLIADLRYCAELITQRDSTIELQNQQIAAFNTSEQVQYQTQLDETQQQLTYYFNESINKNSKIQELFIEIQTMKFDHTQEMNQLKSRLIQAQKFRGTETQNNAAKNEKEMHKLNRENTRLKQMIQKLEDVNNARLGIINQLKKQSIVSSANESVYKKKCKKLQTRNDSLTKELKELQQTFCEQIESDKQKLSLMECELKQKNDKLFQLQNRNKEFDELIQKKTLEFNASIDGLCNKIKKLENKVTDYKQKFAANQNTNANTKKVSKKKRTFNELNTDPTNAKQNKRRKIVTKDLKINLNPLWEKDNIMTLQQIKTLEKEEIFVVDRIVGHRVVNAGEREYKYEVKWFGYGMDQTTWEPQTNLNPFTIQNYWKSQKG